MLHIEIMSEGMILNGTKISNAPPLDQILNMLMPVAIREEQLRDKQKNWRKFIVLDDLGVYLLYDYEVDRVIDVHFCLGTSRGRGAPKCVFSGLLFVNGTRLIQGMSEKDLPIKGNLGFAKRGGWEASSEKIFAHMQLFPRTKRLRAVAVTFLKRPRFVHE